MRYCLKKAIDLAQIPDYTGSSCVRKPTQKEKQHESTPKKQPPQRKQLQPPKRQRQPQKPRLPPQSQALAKKSFWKMFHTEQRLTWPHIITRTFAPSRCNSRAAFQIPAAASYWKTAGTNSIRLHIPTYRTERLPSRFRIRRMSWPSITITDWAACRLLPWTTNARLTHSSKKSTDNLLPVDFSILKHLKACFLKRRQFVFMFPKFLYNNKRNGTTNKEGFLMKTIQ